ncbi:quinone oxidoreductase family protein [Micrococcoides hystricis]|uniref:Quinone oxidoreductase n=1 Tax=Micrococcoides hystricis TaxID=1572761 RepID=A0ABV6P862_9MICC
MAPDSSPQLPNIAEAILIDAPGGADDMYWGTRDVPTLSDTEVLIKTAAAGVNFIDTYQRSGVYKVDYPFTPGQEVSGHVAAVGAAVSEFSIGDYVATANGVNGYGQYAVAEADKVFAARSDLDPVTAAAFPLQGMTAHYLINSTFKVEPGMTVLSYAGAGGVGLVLTQLLKAKGATVITTASTPEKIELAKSAGADHVLGYDNVAQQVRELTNGKGVDVVYDGVGKDTFEESLNSLAVRGMLVLFGGASGQVPPLDPQRLNALGGLYLTRPMLAHYVRDRQELTWRANELMESIASGELKIHIGQRYNVQDAAQAHRDLEGRKTTGKLVLTFQS